MDFLKRIVPNSLFLVLPLNLRLSLILFLLTLFLSLNGQVKFPFEDLLVIFSIPQRKHTRL